MNNNYLLILESKPGDFMPIALNTFSEGKNFDGSIESIDAITSNYTEKELLEEIKKLNIVQFRNLEGKLLIKGSGKARLEVLFKDTFSEFILNDYIIDNIEDKQFLNKIFNKCKSLIDNYSKEKVDKYLKRLKLILDSSANNDEEKNNKVNQLFKHLNILPYCVKRKFNFYFLELDIIKRNNDLISNPNVNIGMKKIYKDVA